MRLLIKILLLIVPLMLMCRCGRMMDALLSGKADCFYLSTDSLEIRYECGEKDIRYINVYLENTGEARRSLLFSVAFTQPAKKYILPIDRETLNKNSIDIEMQLTGDHHRHNYHISLKPGDINRKDKIGSRFFGH